MHIPHLSPFSPSWNQKPCKVPSVSQNSTKNGHELSCWADALLPDLCVHQISWIGQCSAPSDRNDTVSYDATAGIFSSSGSSQHSGESPRWGKSQSALGSATEGAAHHFSWNPGSAPGLCASTQHHHHTWPRCPKCWPKLDMQIIKTTTAATRVLYKSSHFLYDSDWSTTSLQNKKNIENRDWIVQSMCNRGRSLRQINCEFK